VDNLNALCDQPKPVWMHSNAARGGMTLFSAIFAFSALNKIQANRINRKERKERKEGKSWMASKRCAISPGRSECPTTQQEAVWPCSLRSLRSLRLIEPFSEFVGDKSAATPLLRLDCVDPA